MEFARINRDKIIKMYVDEGKSSYEIAENLGTYSTRILRALDFLGIEKRDYKEAQKKAIATGRVEHPTKGKKLNDSHKKNIGAGRSDYYQSLSQEEKDRISKLSKKAWDEMGKEKQAELRRLALESVREASKSGSKTEKHLRNHLTSAGFVVEFHKTGLISGSKLEVDLFLPEIGLAIEIDGPGHFLPIWGEEKMRKQQSDDTIKQGILLNSGYSILRIRQIDKSISLTNMENLSKTVIEEIQRFQKKKTKKGQLIEIEVKNGKTGKV